MRAVLVAIILDLASSPLRAADAYTPRQLYALVLAGETVCPDLVRRRGSLEGLGYDPHASGEVEKLIDAKNAWYDAFNKAPRSVTCAKILQKFGEKGRHPLFDEARPAVSGLEGR